MSSYFEKLLAGVDEGLKGEFLKLKELHEGDFQQYREEFTNTFWLLYESVASLIEENSPLEQRFFLRTGIIDPRYISKEDLAKLRDVFETQESDVFYYADEWLINVRAGKIPPSTFEDVIQESKTQKTVDVSWLKKEYERKIFERSIEEEKLRDLAKGVQGKGPYSKGVYVVFDEIVKTIGNLRRMDNEIKGLFETIQRAEEQSRAAGSQTAEKEHFTEAKVLRQMVRKTLSKTGNTYPALSSNFLRDVSVFLSKRKVLQLFEEFKKLDPTTLQRKIRGSTIYMPPYFILVPGYGEIGFCWEPVEGNNPYGRGRVVAPIFSRKGIEPFFQAFGDYRWKLEKELSFGRWMEEGLTGEYYKFLEENKLKGNPAEYFVKDYVLWITKESRGIQKLEKPVREIFWFNIPFDEKLREELSKLSYVYKDLWERDLRRRQREGGS